MHVSIMLLGYLVELYCYYFSKFPVELNSVLKLIDLLLS